MANEAICGFLNNVVFNNGDDTSRVYPPAFFRATLVMTVDGKPWNMDVNDHFKVLNNGKTLTVTEFWREVVGVNDGSPISVSVCLTNGLMTVQ